MRARLVGVALLLAAAAAWVGLVRPHRERAMALAAEQARLEERRAALAAEVAELEHHHGGGDAGGTLGPVALRAAVVEALAPARTARAVRLDVSGDGAELNLALFGELDDVLDFVDRLTLPEGPAVLTRVSLRPRSEGEIQLQLGAVQPGAQR